MIVASRVSEGAHGLTSSWVSDGVMAIVVFASWGARRRFGFSVFCH